jgi:hypothetical protein
MKKHTITDEIKANVLRTVEQFNTKTLAKTGQQYIPRFKGKYLYLDRDDGGAPGPICRLEFTGREDNWVFAIYKFSSETYDGDEWMFPGAELVDGTIEGALKAGMKAYAG